MRPNYYGDGGSYVSFFSQSLLPTESTVWSWSSTALSDNTLFQPLKVTTIDDKTICSEGTEQRTHHK